MPAGLGTGSPAAETEATAFLLLVPALGIQRRPGDRRIDHVGIGFLADGRPYHIGTGHRYTPARRVLSVPAVTAACRLVSRNLFDKFDGVDTDFVNGYEDTDLCLRMRRAGHRHATASRSVVLHHISASPGRKNHEDRNLALFLERWKNYCEDLYRQESAQWRQVETGLQMPMFFHIEHYLRPMEFGYPSQM